MDGWSNNSSYTSGNNSSGGWGNSGESATSRGYGSSSSDYSSSSSNDSAYWSGVYGGNKSSSAPENQKGVYSTPTAQQFLNEEIANKRATPDMVKAGKAMIAGKEAAQGQQVMGGMLGTLGTAAAGPVGGIAAKGATYAIGKAQDALSEYGDDPSYQLSKQRTKDDGTLVGTAIGLAAPRGIGDMVQSAYDDKMGDYSSYVNGLKGNMQKSGYISNTPQRSVQMNGSNNANGLLNTMFAQQQVTQPDTENSIAALNYGNFTPSYGSVI